MISEPSELLSVHGRHLNALRLESGFAADSFERLIVAVLYQVARYVYVLPATREEHHTEPGGLFRLAMESACLAFRCADGKFLGGDASTPIQNRLRERVRRYVSFLGGLLIPIGRCATQMHVRVHNRKECWDPYREPLWVWCKRANAYKLDIEWRSQPPMTSPMVSPIATVWIAARIVPEAALDYLRSVEESLAEKLLQVVSCGMAVDRPARTSPNEGRLEEIVARAYRDAVNQDLIRSGIRSPGDPEQVPATRIEMPAAKDVAAQIAAVPSASTAPAPATTPAPEIALEAAPPVTSADPRQPPQFAAANAAPAADLENLKALNRFGDAGRILKSLAQQLLARPDDASNKIVAMDEGIALAYPEAIAPFCQQPQQFLHACEAQGLLIADKAAGQRTLRTRAPGQPGLPEHYVVLAPRVAKYLRLPAATSVGA